MVPDCSSAIDVIRFVCSSPLSRARVPFGLESGGHHLFCAVGAQGGGARHARSRTVSRATFGSRPRRMTSSDRMWIVGRSASFSPPSVRSASIGYGAGGGVFARGCVNPTSVRLYAPPSVRSVDATCSREHRSITSARSVPDHRARCLPAWTAGGTCCFEALSPRLGGHSPGRPHRPR